jgi:putative ABC transport system permease protein
MQLSATGKRYRENKAVVQFYKEMGERIAHLPGVVAQGVVSVLPLTGTVGWGQINVEGFHPAPGQELQVDMRTASSGYFETMHIPLRKGRYFSDHDTADGQQVAIVDDRFAQRFWPHENPIGKHLWFDHPEKPLTIVGVVGTVKQYGLDDEGKIVVYFAQAQQADNRMFLTVRTAGEPGALAGPVVREIHATDSTVAVYQIRTMRDLLYDSLARQRFATTMLGAFALFALLLAAIGVYGVLSYLVSQSTHDIGVRVALGAQRGAIVGMVVRQGMELAVLGIAAGLIGAAALTRVMASLLFGVSATDAVTFSGVALLLAAVAMLATYIPARRATKVDPMVALREE